MFEKIKGLARHTAVYGIGDTAGRAIGLILLPLYTSVFSREVIGAMTLAFSLAAFAGIFYTLGMNYAVLRYFAGDVEKDDRMRILSTEFTFLLLVSAILSLVLWRSSESVGNIFFGVPGWDHLVRMVAVILFLDTLSSMCMVVLRAQERSGTYTIITLLRLFSSLVLNIYLVTHRREVEAVFEANIITSALVFLVSFPFVANYLRPYISIVWLEKLLKFGLVFVPSVFCVMIIEVSDRYLLRRFLNLEEVGIYSVCYKLGLVSLFLARAFSLAWPTFFLSLSQNANAPDPEEAKSVYARVMTYFILASVFVMLATSVFARDIVRFLPTPDPLTDYTRGWKVIPVVCLAYTFYGVYINLMAGVFIKDKTGYLPFVTGVGAFINVVLNIVLIPIIGMMGAALSTLAAYAVMVGSLYAVTHRVYRIVYEFDRILKIALSGAVVFVVGVILLVEGGESGSFFNTGFKIASLGGYFLLLWAFGFFYDEEKALISRKLRI